MFGTIILIIKLFSVTFSSSAFEDANTLLKQGRGTNKNEVKADVLLQEAVDYGAPDANAIARVLDWMNQ